MTVPAIPEERTVLLVLPDKNQICPLSTAAFTMANNARHMLWSDYRNALIMESGGILRRFERIDVLGPLGKSLVTRFLNRLTNYWSIRVYLSEPLTYSLDEIKQVLIDSLKTPESVDNMEIESEVALAQFVESVRAAASMSELFDCLKLPDPIDALDLL